MLAKILRHQLAGVGQVQNHLRDLDAQAMEEIRDGRKPGILRPVRAVGTPDERPLALAQPAVPPAAALLLQGSKGRLGRIEIQRCVEARIGPARVVHRAGRRNIVPHEDTIRIEHRPSQLGVVPEHHVVQMRPRPGCPGRPRVPAHPCSARRAVPIRPAVAPVRPGRAAAADDWPRRCRQWHRGPGCSVRACPGRSSSNPPPRPAHSRPARRPAPSRRPR